MTEPAKYDPKITPAIVIGGKLWPVSKLVPNQMRHIYHQVMSVTDALSTEAGGTFGDKVVQLTNEQYDQVCEVVYRGLTKEHPAMSFDEFMNMETTPAEMVIAFLVVRGQTGMFKEVAAGEGGTPGEATEGPQTGTPSSQDPAGTSEELQTIGKAL